MKEVIEQEAAAKEVIEAAAQEALAAPKAPERRVISRDHVLKQNDHKVEWVDMSAFWGGGWGCWVHSMDGKTKGAFEASMGLAKGPDQQKNWETFRARIIVATAMDSEVRKEAKPIFRESDVDALNEKNAAALEYLAKVGTKLSGFAQKDVDEMTKN